ncbi:Ig-like domain-containing protein, partial [Thermoproteota archaeon]
MNRILKQNNRGIASVFGTVFILFLVIFLASTLFVSLYSYEENAQESIDIEQERVQEKIVLLSLSTNNVSGTEYLNSLLINNTGTIITRIRAIYIDNIFICDPTDSSLNPYDTYINPKDYLNVQLPNNLLYEPLSKIEVATERGIKSVEYEWMLRGGNQTDSPSEIQKIYFGPLLLDFDKFYYTKYEDLSDPNSWKPGWSVENSLEVVWNITVTNIDDRNLTINEYSGFTIVPNAEGAQKPWFIEPPNGQDTIFIPSNTTVSLIYIWDGPQSGATQSVYNQNQECRIFMSFFGIFHEKDGSTKPYGQTIPFEAVLLRDPQIEIVADPTVIAAGSSMTSIITVTVLDVMGLIADNVQVNFTTTLGNIPPVTITDSNGVATVTLSPGLTPGTAIITATAENAEKSTSVEIVPGTLTIEADPSTLAANSTTTSEITARVILNGSPLAGETVTFTNENPELGELLSPTTVTTDGQGYATVTFDPGTDIGTATITAEWGILPPLPISVEIVPGTLTIEADPSTL